MNTHDLFQIASSLNPVSLHKEALDYYLPGLSRSRTASSSELTKTLAMQALQALNAKLEENNRKVSLLLIGGGAMLLVYGTREATADLDVIPVSKSDRSIIESCRNQVTRELKEVGLEVPFDWINFAAEPIFRDQSRYFQPGDFRPVSELSFSHLQLFVATPPAILAMKVQALRFDSKDQEDVRTLIKMLKIRSWEQFLSIVEPRVEDINILGNDDIANIKHWIWS